MTMCLHDGKAQDIEFWLPSYRTALALLSVCMSVNVRARVCVFACEHMRMHKIHQGVLIYSNELGRITRR